MITPNTLFLSKHLSAFSDYFFAMRKYYSVPRKHNKTVLTKSHWDLPTLCTASPAPKYMTLSFTKMASPPSWAN